MYVKAGIQEVLTENLFCQNLMSNSGIQITEWLMFTALTLNSKMLLEYLFWNVTAFSQRN